jgi:hypothetical protein
VQTSGGQAAPSSAQARRSTAGFSHTKVRGQATWSDGRMGGQLVQGYLERRSVLPVPVSHPPSPSQSAGRFSTWCTLPKGLSRVSADVCCLAAGDDRCFLGGKGMPPRGADSGLLQLLRERVASKHLRGPSDVPIVALLLATIVITVERRIIVEVPGGDGDVLREPVSHRPTG